MKVLVVDDENVARTAIAQVLRRAGYDVITASSGHQALDMLLRHACQLVVTDWNMPVMDGVSLCKAIRALERGHYIYIIMVTSNDGSSDVTEGLAAGADDYITKPFNASEFIMRINIGRRIVGLETRDIAIFVMAKLAESRDPETGEHLARVREYCQVIATQLNKTGQFPTEIDSGFIKLIFDTSPLHDIGKIAIPDAVLLKPDRLTDSEFEIIKRHTLEGAATLEAAMERFPNAEFLRMARDIALTHHEWFDGNGYPFGLQGNEIPLSGRIVAIADVYDALTSQRVYKSAYSHDVAKRMIIEQSGKQFDPVIVQGFLECEEAILDIRLAHEDNTECFGVDEIILQSRLRGSRSAEAL